MKRKSASRIRKHHITLEKKNGKILAARVPVTPEMMRLAKGGAKMCGASVEQCLVWGISDGVSFMRSAFEDGHLRENGHEPHLIKV